MTWPAGIEYVERMLAENPGTKRAVRGAWNRKGGYTVALAIRFGEEIVSKVIEFDNTPNIEFFVLGVIDGISEGIDPATSGAQWREIMAEAEKSELSKDPKSIRHDNHRGEVSARSSHERRRRSR